MLEENTDVQHGCGWSRGRGLKQVRPEYGVLLVAMSVPGTATRRRSRRALFLPSRLPKRDYRSNKPISWWGERWVNKLADRNAKTDTRRQANVPTAQKEPTDDEPACPCKG